MKKKLLAVVLAVCMVATMMLVPAMAADEGTFTDVSSDHWASDAIERWAGYGILNGTDAEAGTFDPEGGMTRAQFAKVVVELLGLPTDSTEMPFEDVIGSNDDWAKGHIAAAYAAGIVNGASDTKFAPRRSVSFDDSAAILSRALGLVDPKAYGEEVTTVLDELNMLGALEDFVSGDADMNRAAVAALASNMIETYVTPDNVADVTEDGVLSGEFSGIILVVGDVEVDINNATVTAPIVVQGASVTLTGTTAADVKVGGESASVTADEDSSVANVTVGGSDATVELNGEVTGSVTVAADAEGELTLTVPEDVDVDYNNTADITVNGETVEGTPVEEEPGEDDENPGEDDEQGESTGFVPSPSTPATNPEEDEEPAATTPKVPAASAGEVVEDEDSEAEAHTHTWSETVSYTGEGYSEATCTNSGKGYYTCTVEGCGAKSVVTVPALGHNWYRKTVVSATCEATGTVTWACANDPACKKFPASGDNEATNDETIPALGHNQVNIAAVAATCTTAGKTAGIGCSRCATKDEEGNITAYTEIWTGCNEVAALGHSYVKKVTGTGDEAVTKYVCSRCEDEQENCPNTSNHASILKGSTCPICGVEGTAEAHTHSWATAWTTDDNYHWHNCTAEGCTVTNNSEKNGYGAHSYVYATDTPSATGTCTCGKTETCIHEGTVTDGTCSKCHMTGIGG